MEIEKLQQAWSQLSSRHEANKEFDENEILKILNSRSRNAIEKIDWNIRIGLFLLFFLLIVVPIIIIITDPSRFDTNLTGDVHVPEWIFVLGVLSFLLLCIFLGSFIYNYYHVKRICRGACDLRTTLIKILKILKIYFRLFGFGFLIVFITGVAAFSAGFFEGYHIAEGSLKFQLIGLFFLVLIVGSVTGCLFLLFRWLFRKMYSNYIVNLKQNLKELDELNFSDGEI